jgi:hypothetical protein
MNFARQYSILLLLLLPGARVDAGDNPVPGAWPADRYAGISRRSPFALASPLAAASVPQAAFAANWYVGGIARLGNADFVTIKSRDLSTHFSLFGQEPDLQTGVVLTGVNWSDAVGQSTVTIRKGGEIARLEFNEADLRNPAPAATAGGAGAKKTSDASGGLQRAPATALAGPALANPSRQTENLNIRRRVRPIGTPP